MDDHHETCFLCDQPTGRAGQGDDSFYDDNDCGPYCEGCWDVTEELRGKLSDYAADCEDLRAERDRLESRYSCAMQEMESVVAERGRLAAENAGLRGALDAARLDLENVACEIEAPPNHKASPPEHWRHRARQAQRALTSPSPVTAAIERVLEAVVAILPAIGWHGGSPSHRDLYQCEFCGAEHRDDALIEHASDCVGLRLRAAHDALQALLGGKGESP